MDAIRKKMQSLKGETESLYATIRRFEDQTKEYQRVADQVSTHYNSVMHMFRYYLGVMLGKFLLWNT
jgi:hypothetical protein